MTIIALLSAKGSPGVTTAAAALAAAAAERGTPATIIELDPAGGTLALDTQRPLEPGLTTLLAAARRGLDPALIDRHCQTLPNGVNVLFGPTSPVRAAKASSILAEPLASALRHRDGITFVDLGRWEGDRHLAPVLTAADHVWVMLRPTLAGTEHVRTRLDSITALNPHTHVACVGDNPYSPAEVASALAVEVRPELASDPRAAQLVVGGVPLDRWLRRTSLMRSTYNLLDDLVDTPTLIEVMA